ncbi:hypothetical protein LZ017_13160 [Pelomonas sp. CA6]|uniref:hypothetical protein n=1 Tax=Pelomonas sp. CA6 TaxID=2907999 RepID=UPI001F4BF572|nr:hypothetical protein [Pelomonas sp. CA6]MCH7344326.1 hypothetical protein [Pelomonas sp. CA6]
MFTDPHERGGAALAPTAGLAPMLERHSEALQDFPIRQLLADGAEPALDLLEACVEHWLREMATARPDSDGRVAETLDTDLRASFERVRQRRRRTQQALAELLDWLQAGHGPQRPH